MFGSGYDNRKLFRLALGLSDPWEISAVDFSAEKERLDIHVHHTRGYKFPCGSCNQECSVHDVVEREWRHLNFFQYEAYIHAPVPRIKCGECGGIKQVEVPWSRPGSGFTILFEAFVLELARELPMGTTGEIVGEHDTRLFRIVKHYVFKARGEVDMSEVRCIGVDETSTKKGHNYVTVVTDLEAEKVLYATEGKDHETILRFVQDFQEHGGDVETIQAASIDLSPAYQKGMAEHLPDVEVTFDHFHVISLVNKSVDEVRRREAKDEARLKHSRYCWLKNPTNLKSNQRTMLANLSNLNLKTGRAYRIKLALQDIYRLKDHDEAESALKKWYYWATHSRLPEIIKVAKTIKAHWEGVLNYFKGRLTNGLVECFNGIIQTIKCRGRGYRNTDNFITMIYLVKGKLDFKLPSVTKITHC